MKRLQRYYYLVGVPLLLLLLGSAVFFEAILGTVRGNPHPQINYLIFALLIGGGALMLMHVRRINTEGRFVQEFMDKLKYGDSPEDLDTWLAAHEKKGHQDLAGLLRDVLDVQGRVVGTVEHAAIEAEIKRFQAQQQRRLLLAQYLPGLMVGLGLFGTFIGLLGALKEIGLLIGGFSIDAGTSDPVATVTELIARLTAPMKSMGVAFSASLFGVLGSMVMGMLVVFVKGATAELVSLVHSRVSWLMDLSKSSGSETFPDMQPLQEALAELSNHSPLFGGLLQALDQSERRVRQLVDSNTTLAARLDQLAQHQVQLAHWLQDQTQHLTQQREITEQMQKVQRQGLDIQERVVLQQNQLSQQLTQQQEALQNTLTRQTPWADALAQLTQAQAVQLQHLQQQWGQGLAGLREQMNVERQALQAQSQALMSEQQQMVKAVLSVVDQFERERAQLSAGAARAGQSSDAAAMDWASVHKQLTQLITQTQQQLAADSQQRLEVALQTRQTLQEMQARQEQMLHAALTQK